MRRRDFALSSGAVLASLYLHESLRSQDPTHGSSVSTPPTAAEEELSGPATGPWRRLFLDTTVVLRLDGFCSMRTSGAQAGWLITRREPFHQPAVTINARTQPGGTIAAEILDRNNQVLPGFSRDDCVVFQGDSVRHELRWNSDQFSSDQVRKDYKLRFWLNDAELFSYLPVALDPRQPDLARIQLTGP